MADTSTSIRLNVADRLAEGRQIARRNHVDSDQKKLGTLRAGNSGILSADGDFAGACHRKAHLRSLGIEVEVPNDSKLVMFQMGTANEEVIYRDLIYTSAPDEIILREEEIPTRWFTTNGTPVTGRPDMVICRKEEAVTVPLLGIEIKSIASVWTSRDVLGEQTPKLDHLIQAAHYSWQLGIPFLIVYKQYSIQEIPGWKGAGGTAGWGQKLFPKQGEPGSEHIDYVMGRIQPFEISYELGWSRNSPRQVIETAGKSGKAQVSRTEHDGGRVSYLTYRREGSTEKPVATLITQADIQRYYEFVSRMGETGDLGHRPLTISATGKEKSWSLCDAKYCPLSAVCDKHEASGYQKWLTEVRRVVAANQAADKT